MPLLQSSLFQKYILLLAQAALDSQVHIDGVQSSRNVLRGYQFEGVILFGQCLHDLKACFQKR